MRTKLIHTVAALALIPALSLAGCAMTENYLKADRDTNQEIQDYRDALAPREIPAENQSSAGIPDFADYVVDDAANLTPMPLVTISVNENIPLKDVLYELAQQANYDVELDPRISGAVIFSARNRPFDQVMSRIADMAGLRYKMSDNVVRIEVDTPYSQSYKLDYLPMVRKVDSKVQNDVTISGSSDAGGSTATGSKFSVTGTSEFDFWKNLDVGLKQIIEANAPENTLRTGSTPIISASGGGETSPTTPPPPPAEGDTSAVATGADIPAAPSLEAPSGTVDVSSVPTSPTAVGEYTPSYSINQQAGLISVYANEKTHRKVAEYLTDLRRASTSQVLIEAKVFEVSLTDEFAAGIDWSFLDLPDGVLNFTSTAAPPALDPTTISTFAAGVDGADFRAIMSAVSRFGTVHALASPRLTVLNNQSAVLNVARNQTYFELEIETTQDGGGGSSTTVDSTIKTVPEGVLVNVTPSIDLDHKEVTMTLRPTISNIDSFVNDPGVAIAVGAGSTIQSRVPNVSIQEFDSVVKLRSGETAVMGGLLKDKSASDQNGAPILSEMPLIGGLFRDQADKVSKTELVVFLRATIVDNGTQTIHQTDRDLYKLYAQDRRPFPM